MTNQAIQLSREALQSLTLWTAADIAHVKEMIAPQANEQEFRLLLYMANKYELDPLLRQIWCVKYGAKPAQIFAGRDGFLAIAHRTGNFDGLNTPIRIEQVPIHIEYTYYRDNRQQTGVLERAFQYVATAHAYNKSAHHPVVVEVWEEEYSTGRDLWATKPRTMLTKVAECQAVRKAFNISGLYEPSEMGHEGAIEGTAVEITETNAQAQSTSQKESGGQSPVAAAPVAAQGVSAPHSGNQSADLEADQRRVSAVLRRRKPGTNPTRADVTQEFVTLVGAEVTYGNATPAQWHALAEALEAESPADADEDAA